MKRIALLTMAVALAVPAPATAAKRQVFVGKLGKLAVGVAFDARTTLAYVCDNDHVGLWFKGGRLGGKELTLANGNRRLVLERAGSRLDVKLGRKQASLRRATGRAGLYRSDNEISGQRRLGGWVVEKDGRVTGTLATGTTISSAPQLSTQTLRAGSLVVSPVFSPTDTLPVILDLDGDGLDAGGSTDTTLLGPNFTHARTWTRAGDDDVFVALDAAELAQAGYSASFTGLSLVRGGLTITRGSTTHTAVDGFDALRTLDANRDGRVDASDPAWSALRLFGDRDGNGNFGDSPGLNGGDMLAKMAAMNMQFLALQEATQMESRRFQTLSTSSRARHALAIASIRNIG